MRLDARIHIRVVLQLIPGRNSETGKKRRASKKPEKVSPGDQLDIKE